MNLIIEVIDGVAYAVVDGKCGDCALQHDVNCVDKCNDLYWKCYRRLTSKERVEVQKALGRGMDFNNNKKKEEV